MEDYILNRKKETIMDVLLEKTMTVDEFFKDCGSTLTSDDKFIVMVFNSSQEKREKFDKSKEEALNSYRVVSGNNAYFYIEMAKFATRCLRMRCENNIEVEDFSDDLLTEVEETGCGTKYLDALVTKTLTKLDRKDLIEEYTADSRDGTGGIPTNYSSLFGKGSPLSGLGPMFGSGGSLFGDDDDTDIEDDEEDED